MNPDSMQEIIGISGCIIGIMWLVVMIYNEILSAQEVDEWLAKRNQHKRTKQNYQNCQNEEKND